MNYIFAMCIASYSIISSVGSYLQIALRNKGYSHSLVGMLMALSQIATIVFPIIVGNISDRKRKKKYLLIICTIGTIIGYNIAFLSGNIIFTLISIVFGAGLFWSIFPLQDSLINGFCNGDSIMYSRARTLGTASYLVVLVLFALTHFPNETNNNSICLAITGFSLFFLITTLILPKSVEQKAFNMKVYEPTKEEEAKGQWYDPTFKLLLIIVALSRFTNSIVDRFLSSYMVENLHMGNSFVLFFAWGAITEFFFMRLAGRTIQQKKLQPWFWILIGSIMEVVRILFYAFIPTKFGFFLGQSLHGFTFGALHIGVMSYISSHVDSKHSGKAMSWYWAGAVNFPVAIGAFIGGFIIQKYGYTTLFLAYIPTSVIASILCFINRKKFIIK